MPRHTPESLERRLADEGHPCIAGIYADEPGAAKLCESSERTMRRWRAKGIGPRWIRLSRILYDLADIAAFLNSGGLPDEKKSAADGREWPEVAARDMDTAATAPSNRSTQQRRRNTA